MPSIAERTNLQKFSELEWMELLPKLGKLVLSKIGDTLFERQRDDRATPETIAPKHSQLAAAGIKHLSAIIGQLVKLRKEEEEDEYGLLRATEYAFEKASELVIDAAIISTLKGRSVPRGCASTDSEGGIRIEWVRQVASVHLVVGAADNQKSYIYHEVGSDYATKPATSEVLAEWLNQID
jgi:hypothetical protein